MPSLKKFLKKWNDCWIDNEGIFHSRDDESLILFLQDSTIQSDAKCLSAANAPAMDYDASAETATLVDLLVKLLIINPNKLSTTFPPASNDDLSAALIEHFMKHMQLASVGRICTLWLDYAVSELNGAGCKECLELASFTRLLLIIQRAGTPRSSLVTFICPVGRCSLA